MTPSYPEANQPCVQQATDNTFWVFKQMLGLTTRGAVQVYTVAQSGMVLIGLANCLVLDLIF